MLAHCSASTRHCAATLAAGFPRTPVILDKQTICEPKAATGIDLHQAAARMLAIVDLTISQDHFTDRMSLR